MYYKSLQKKKKHNSIFLKNIPDTKSKKNKKTDNLTININLVKKNN